MIEVIPKQNPVNASIQVPGSKSYSNRALLLAALANGKSIISNILESDDTKYMISALKELGIKIIKKENQYFVYGNGGKFKKPTSQLYLGNAGTAVRFLTAALTISNFKCVLTGDKRMQERPISDLINTLKRIGADVESTNGCPPVYINHNRKGKNSLIGGSTWISGINSSQYLSALLMIAPYAEKEVEIILKDKLTSLPYITMTIDTMKKFGVSIENQKFKKFIVKPAKYKATNFQVEADTSSATYAMAIAAINNGKITIKDLSIKSKQADIHFLKILKKMGCKIISDLKDITVIGPEKLKALGTINLNHMPDAAMTVAILASFAKGKSTLKGLDNLRIKETNRLSGLSNELQKIGVKVKQGKNYLEINGTVEYENLHGAIIETYNDHRMAMCFAIVGSKIPGIKILNPNCVAKTYPTFWKDFKKIGINHKKIKPNIVLTGLRGTGKSSIGKSIAQKIGYKFIDTDLLIEQKLRKKIPIIIKEKGWSFFRKQEETIARSLANYSNTLISTGGGMIINETNAKNLKRNGYFVLLKCNPEIAATRVKNSYQRPSLTNQKNILAEIKQLWQERKEKYLKISDLIYDTSTNKTTIAKATEIIKILKLKNVI